MMGMFHTFAGRPMDTKTARFLIELNNRFYRDHAASFSATRQAPWPGWERVLDEAAPQLAVCDAPRVLDLACGNLRFERFLSSCLATTPACWAVDAADELSADAPRGDSLRYRHADILGALLEGHDPLAGIPACDLSVCFGFMHHVPGARLRAAVGDLLAAHTRPHGFIALSFWRFLDDERLAAKADAADARAAAFGLPTTDLDEGDRYLGWQDDRDAWRYCHHFSEADVDACAEHLADAGAHEVCRFSADGRSGALNRYLICRMGDGA